MTTTITQEAGKRAADFVNNSSDVSSYACLMDTFIAYIQRVSDAAEDAIKLIENSEPYNAADIFRTFILPKPAPDVLLDVMRSAFGSESVANADRLRAELAKRGGRIVFNGDKS